MKYNLLYKNLESDQDLIDYVDEKLAKIHKFYPKIISVAVELSRNSKHHSGPVFRAEVNVLVPGHLLRVVEFAYDIKPAIDQARDKLVRQLQKIHSKEQDQNKKSARKIKK